MDPLKLLSRSTKGLHRPRQDNENKTPSSGQNVQPQLFSEHEYDQSTRPSTYGKRKRGEQNHNSDHNSQAAFQFFGAEGHEDGLIKIANARPNGSANHAQEVMSVQNGSVEGERTDPVQLSDEERKRILKQHKLKIVWLNPPLSQKNKRRKSRTCKRAEGRRESLFPYPLRSFDELRSRYSISSTLVANIADQGYSVPTEVQLVALPLLLEDTSEHTLKGERSAPSLVTTSSHGTDLLTVAPTGSGKTLAFMIPLLQSLLQRRQRFPRTGRCTSAIILAPTKELVGQTVNEGRKLCRGTGMNISQLRRGTKLAGMSPASLNDRYNEDDTETSAVKSDIVVSTPGLLQSIIDECPKSTLPQVQDLIIDEADVLLDALFREQTLSIWNNLTDPELRVSMWSATMGSNIEELAVSTMNKRRRRLTSDESDEGKATPIVRLVVGLKDSAVPNVQHKLIYAATEQGKLLGLRQLLHPTSSSVDSGPSLLPPFLVFTQTIERAIALHAELLYDIPAEAGGIRRIAVLHSDLSDTARDSVVSGFRSGEIWVIITTDLLSRGVDFRGINGVVNYDIPNSSAAYVHRVGRTGRAGRAGGVAATFYSKEDIPYLKHVVNVVTVAQKQKEGEKGTQQWLLDALPTLSKNEKQKFKKHGVDLRTARGKQKNPKASKKARISTKAGFVRRTENRRKEAIHGTHMRMQNGILSDEGDETDFGGFD